MFVHFEWLVEEAAEHDQGALGQLVVDWGWPCTIRRRTGAAFGGSWRCGRRQRPVLRSAGCPPGRLRCMTGGWCASMATKRSPGCSCRKSPRTCPGLLRSKIPRSTADCRAYMSPPVPDAYEGNCVALCMASLSGSELAAVREAIAEAKRKPLHDLARWRTKFAVIQRGRRGSRVRASRRGQAVEGHLQVGGGGAERHITLGGGHGWENFYPHTKSFAGSPPRGEKNASWGPQRLEML
ncbi:hypothetical protein ACQJBY_047770 [Aegilops geniculata]